MMNETKENSKYNIHCKAWSRLQLQKKYKEYQQWWRHCDEDTKINNWTTNGYTGWYGIMQRMNKAIYKCIYASIQEAMYHYTTKW